MQTIEVLIQYKLNLLDSWDVVEWSYSQPDSSTIQKIQSLEKNNTKNLELLLRELISPDDENFLPLIELYCQAIRYLKEDISTDTFAQFILSTEANLVDKNHPAPWIHGMYHELDMWTNDYSGEATLLKKLAKKIVSEVSMLYSIPPTLNKFE